YRLLGIPAEELCRIGDLPARVRKRLAVLEGDQLGEAFPVRHDNLIGLAQNLGALARLASAPPFERLLRGVDSGFGILDAGARHRGDDVLGRRVDDLEACGIGGLAPLAADPKIGRNIGEQIFIHGVCSLSGRFCVDAVDLIRARRRGISAVLISIARSAGGSSASFNRGLYLCRTASVTTPLTPPSPSPAA